MSEVKMLRSAFIKSNSKGEKSDYDYTALR